MSDDPDTNIPTPDEFYTRVSETMDPVVDAELQVIAAAMSRGRMGCDASKVPADVDSTSVRRRVIERMRARGWAASFVDDQRDGASWSWRRA